LSKDRQQLRIGSKEVAEKEGWIALKDERSKYSSDETFASVIAEITMLTKK
jgi:hypothetical protein